MFRPPTRCRRLGMSRVETLVLGNLLVLTIGLLIPACENHRIRNGTRNQTVNQLKQIGLAVHGFHDGYKRLPFNGTKDALPDDPTSGSWAFQILPGIEANAIFHAPGKATNVGVWALMDPARGRQQFEKDRGPWSDFFINNYVNDPKNAATPNNPDGKVSLLSITDGTSNTILAGQGNIATVEYNKESRVAGCTNIFIGGGAGTMRAGPNWEKGKPLSVAMQRDSSSQPDLAKGGWGGPYPQGCLFAFCDATVRMIPYSTAPTMLGAMMTPTGGEEVVLDE